MSTLNMPAVIARLHGSDQFSKLGQLQRQDVGGPRKRFSRLPDVKHLGIGDRGWVGMKEKDSFWRQPVYLDQVLRKRADDQTLYIRPTLGNKQWRRKYPYFLPKLDEKPIKNTDTAAPFVKGRNIETISGNDSFTTSTPALPGDEDDDDALWTRNAMNGTISEDISRSLSKPIPTSVKPKSKGAGRIGSDTMQTKALNAGRHREIILSKMELLPPIEGKSRIVHAENSVKKSIGPKDESTILEDSKIARRDVSYTMIDGSAELEKKLASSQVKTQSKFSKSLEQKYVSQSHSTKIEEASSHNIEQSTFSRIMHPNSSPKTQAGKKLLSSLLTRPDNEKKSNHKRALPPLKKPVAVLYSEEYLKVADSFEQEMKKMRLVMDGAQKMQRTGEPFGKLPAELTGHHFQLTYENLWKYLKANGGKQNLRPFFTSKQELQKSNPDIIYIPTGRPEEALSVGRVDKKQGSFHESDVSPIKLKYIHRNDELNSDQVRSKDTSPWNIDQHLRTPASSSSKLDSTADQRKTLVQYDAADDTTMSIEHGIKKLSITVPLPEIQAPPSTPVFGIEKPTITDHEACFNNCGYCKPDNTEIATKMQHNKEAEGHLKAKQYPTPVKVINFKKDGLTEKTKTKAKKQPKPRGPIPLSKQESLTTTIAESKDGKSEKKTRYYSQGDYLVKVEESVVKKKKVKLPKDLNNMFTKPYTFSYLAGSQAPSNLSNKLALYSGDVANLSNRKLTTGDKTETSLVTDFRKNCEGARGSVEKQDASTQFEEEDTVEKSSDLTTFQPLQTVSPSMDYQFQLRVSPQPTHKSIHFSSSLAPDEKCAKAGDHPHPFEGSTKIRPLSEGATEIDMRKRRDKVKTYDASKYFRSDKTDRLKDDVL